MKVLVGPTRGLRLYGDWMPKRIAKRLLLGAEWGFLGFLLALSGLSTIYNPETFGLRAALENMSSLIPRFYGSMLFLGGSLIVIGVAFGWRWLQRSGMILLLPPIVFVCVLAPFVGGWNALRSEMTSLAFLALVLLQIFRLFALDKADKDMRKLIRQAKAEKEDDDENQ